MSEFVEAMAAAFFQRRDRLPDKQELKIIQLMDDEASSYSSEADMIDSWVEILQAARKRLPI